MLDWHGLECDAKGSNYSLGSRRATEEFIELPPGGSLLCLSYASKSSLVLSLGMKAESKKIEREMIIRINYARRNRH